MGWKCEKSSFRSCFYSQIHDDSIFITFFHHFYISSKSIYNDEEVRSRSIIEITSPVAFDELGTPLPNGLYDPYLGPTEAKSTSPCPTCGNLYANCPGHAGHIELCAPVYQPLTFGKLLKLLKVKCFACHKYRLSKFESRVFAAKFHLIDSGRLLEALELDRKLAALMHTEYTANDDDKKSEVKRSSGKRNMMLDATRSVTGYLDAIMKSSTGKKHHSPANLTSHEREVRRLLEVEFISTCTKNPKCKHCGAFSPKIRHDNFNKIFQTTLSNTQKKANMAQDIKILPAINANRGDAISGAPTSGWASDDSDMSDDDDEPEGISTWSDDDSDVGLNTMDKHKKDKYLRSTSNTKLNSGVKDKNPDNFMHALETEAQVSLTWHSEPFLSSMVFGSAFTEKGVRYENGYGIFFMRAIPVPPSRFRPPMVLGTMSVEHAQNHYLNQVIELNDRLRISFARVQAIESGEANPEEKEDKDTIQSRAITTWIKMQTIVNCFIDSSKDPSSTPTEKVPNGIRQLLEKKEGMFRKYVLPVLYSLFCLTYLTQFY